MRASSQQGRSRPAHPVGVSRTEEPLRPPQVDDTCVHGSARIKSREDARSWCARRRATRTGAGANGAQMSAYYEAARELASRLTKWSKALDQEERRFVVCTGGARESWRRPTARRRGKGHERRPHISIPVEEFDNRYVTRELAFPLPYFFMRKFWSPTVRAPRLRDARRAVRALDAVQTRKMKKPMPIVLFGTGTGTRSSTSMRCAPTDHDARDIELMHAPTRWNDAYDWIVRQLARRRWAAGVTL